MRIVALEEHFNVPELVAKIPESVIHARGWPTKEAMPSTMDRGEDLKDLGIRRLAAMDAAGVTVQVLSASGPGADLLAGADGVAFARATNDRAAAAVAEHPDRFRGFAHLPLRAPEAAADELERAVKELKFHGALINGLTEGRFLDHPSYAPLLERAAKLDVPIYIHPGIPPGGVREAYYKGLPPKVETVLAAPGWGWHAETAVHVLRLVLAGTFDQHRGLRVIIGHMGEMLPVMLARFDETFAPETKYLSRSVSQTILDHVVITTSGFFALAPFMAALLTFGVERILFSVDYPYAKNASARDFLDRLPVSPNDREAIAHGNADRVLKLKASQ